MPPPKLLATGLPFEPPRYKSVAASWMAQSRGRNVKMPQDVHAEQMRNEIWAAAMEQHLARRFDKKLLAEIGLAGMSLDKADCRESSCRLEISWGPEDNEAAKETRPVAHLPPDPGAHHKSKTGPLAYVEARVRARPDETSIPNSYHIKVGPDGRNFVSTILLFGEEDIDPTKYTQYVARTHAEMQAMRP